MAQIRKLREADKNYIKNIAELYKQAFPTFFLTQLGIPFLENLYAGYMEDKKSGIIVAEDAGILVGFIAYSSDYPQFYKGLIKKRLLKFAICSIGAAIHRPFFIKRILGAFRKSESVTRKENYIELASICVDPNCERKGIGSSMIEFLISIVDFEKYSYINLETDAEQNDSVNRFYLKNGFKLARKYTTPEGRVMNEYRFRR